MEEGPNGHVRQLRLRNIQVVPTRRWNRLTSTQFNLEYEVPNDAPIVDVPELQIIHMWMNSVMISIRLKRTRQARNQPFVNINTRSCNWRTWYTTHSTHQSNMKCQTMHRLLKLPEYKSLSHAWMVRWSWPSRPLNAVIMNQNQNCDYDPPVAPRRKMVSPTHYYQRIPYVNEPKREVPTVETPQGRTKTWSSTVKTLKAEPCSRNAETRSSCSDEPHTGMKRRLQALPRCLSLDYLG